MVKGNKLGLVGKVLLGVGLALGSGSCGEYYMNPKEHIQFFTCNYWEDLNNNKITEYPNEFRGIKKKFRKDEKLELIFRVPLYGIEGKNLNIIIYDSKGKAIYADSSKIKHNNITFNHGFNFNLMQVLLEKGGLGKYLATASFENFGWAHEFEITE